jgi:surfactin synthase thioesterase subunit
MSNLWLTTFPSARVEPRLRLVCFPHAGGSPVIFHRWRAMVPPDVGLHGVHLPGRGARYQEPPFRRLDRLVRVMTPQILPLDAPSVVFGHSFGALLAFETVREARRLALPLPRMLIVSGRGAPKAPSASPPLHLLSDHEFIKALEARYGVADVALRNPESAQLALPSLKGDFEMFETWNYREVQPLPIPIHALQAVDDHVSAEALSGWSEVTSVGFAVETITGGHFHHLTDPEPLASSIARLVR